MAQKRYTHCEFLSLSELEQFQKDHPEVWGNSEYLFHPDNGIVTPTKGDCNLCCYCEGEWCQNNCMNLIYEVNY